MADQVSFDTEKQKAATSTIVASGEAVTSSAQGSSSLGAAQKPMFWGQEAGPQSMGDSSAQLFNKMSDALAKEAELIVTFEAAINAAVKSFDGTEQDNKLRLEAIQEALNQVDKSDAAVAAKAAQHELDLLLGGLGFKGMTLPKQSGTGNSSTTASSAPTTSHGPRKY